MSMASQRSFLHVSGYRLELTISTGDTNPVRFLRERIFGSSQETEIAGGTACRSGKLCAQHRKPGVDDQFHRDARLGIRAGSRFPMPSAPRFFEPGPPDCRLSSATTWQPYASPGHPVGTPLHETVSSRVVLFASTTLSQASRTSLCGGSSSRDRFARSVPSQNKVCSR